MTYVALFFNVFLMITMPLILAWRISAKRKPGWGLFGLGAATFVASQIGHIPFQWLVLQRLDLIPTDVTIRSNLIILALFAGFSAALFEEIARFLTYKYWAPKARTWGKGLMLGAGHGGIEAIILGVLVGVNYVALARMRAGALLSLVPEGQWPAVQALIDSLFSAPLVHDSSRGRRTAICPRFSPFCVAPRHATVCSPPGPVAVCCHPVACPHKQRGRICCCYLGRLRNRGHHWRICAFEPGHCLLATNAGAC